MSSGVKKFIGMVRTKAAYNARGLNWPPPILCALTSLKVRRVYPIQKNCVFQMTDDPLGGIDRFQLSLPIVVCRVV